MDFTDPHFVRPWVLGASAAGVLILAVLLATAARRRPERLAGFLSGRALLRHLSGVSSLRRGLRATLALLALMFLGIAAAGPRWGATTVEEKPAAEDVVFVLDTSKSMLVRDMRPSRLERAKTSIAAFVRRKGTGSVGLVAFSGQAFLQCPLTRDYDGFFRVLGETDTRAIPVAGTDIARALEEAELGVPSVSFSFSWVKCSTNLSFNIISKSNSIACFLVTPYITPKKCWITSCIAEPKIV